jgi:hypothetical protein
MRFENLKDWFNKVDQCHYCKSIDNSYSFYEYKSDYLESNVKMYITEDTLNFFYQNTLYVYDFDKTSQLKIEEIVIDLLIKCKNCKHFLKCKFSFGNKLKIKSIYRNYIINPCSDEELILAIDYIKNKTTLAINSKDYEEFLVNGVETDRLTHQELLEKFKLLKTFI